MQLLLAHGTGSAGAILKSGELRGGSKATAKMGAKSNQIGDSAPPDKIFFSYMQLTSRDYFAEIRTTLSYARKPASPPDVRGILFFSPQCQTDVNFANQGSYGTLAVAAEPLANLDLQIAVFVADDLPASTGGQNPLTAFLRSRNFFTTEPTLDFYPATIPLAQLSNSGQFNLSMAAIIASAKAFGFCYSYDVKGKVI